jgi:hypothetical protein
MIVVCEGRVRGGKCEVHRGIVFAEIRERELTPLSTPQAAPERPSEDMMVKE